MNLPKYPPALKAAGLYFSQALIWVKEHPVLTRKDFMTNHELAFYGSKEGAAHRFFGPPNVPDVWPVKKVSPNKMVHLTVDRGLFRFAGMTPLRCDVGALQQPVRPS